jgi:signal peptidase I
MNLLPWFRKWLLRWEVIVGFTVLVFGAFLSTRIFLYDYLRVPSASMHPTIPSASIVVLNKLGYGNYGAFGLVPFQTRSTAPIVRGDIVVFRSVQNPNTLHVKRVIGMPGDHITYRERQLSINGVQVPTQVGEHDDRYRYATEMIDGRVATIAFLPERFSRDVDVSVPPDHFFMLGDSRDNALDSRFVGSVPRENVVGVVIHIVSSARQ